MARNNDLGDTRVRVDTWDACVDFPIFDAKTRSLKKAFLGKAGGAIGRNESNVVVIEALRDITMSLKMGDRVGLVRQRSCGELIPRRLHGGEVADPQVECQRRAQHAGSPMRVPPTTRAPPPRWWTGCATA